MNNRTLALNIVYAIFDTLIGILGIALFGWMGWHFNRWWISLFALFSIALYNSHTLIINADLQQAELDDLKPQKGGDEDGNEETQNSDSNNDHAPS